MGVALLLTGIGFLVLLLSGAVQLGRSTAARPVQTGVLPV
jgi:hypothetical protein